MYLTSGFDLTNAYDFLVENNHKSGTIFKNKENVLSKKFYLWEHHLMLQRF